MSTYEKLESVTHPTQIEVPLYGSDRLGMWKPGLLRNNNNGGEFNIASVPDPPVYTRNHDGKLYELKDHLGNVRVVIRDWKVNGATSIRSFIPKIVSYSNYYPFGMQMHEDTWESPLYRYGYNGKEKDGEIAGEGNMYDYGFRIYDPRAGRFLSVDPLGKDYPQVSSYLYAGDNPVAFIDHDGKVPGPYSLWLKMQQAGQTALKISRGIAKGWNNYVDGLVESAKLGGEVWLKSTPISGLLNIPTPRADALGGLISEVVVVSATPQHLKSIVPTPKLDALGNKIAKTWEEKIVNGDAESITEVVMEVGLNAATVVVTEGVGVALRAAPAAASMAARSVVARSAATEGAIVTGESIATEMATVGRWMSRAEYDIMAKTGKMVEGAGGQTFVGVGGSNAFRGAAKGSVYVEFDIPKNSLLQGGQDNWFKVIGPGAGKAMKESLEKQGGELLPPVKNLSPVLEVK